MKPKVLIKISDKIVPAYRSSLEKILSKANKTIEGRVEFGCQIYKFGKDELLSIEKSPDSFLVQKLNDFNFNYSTIIYVPSIAINLKGNYIWYAYGSYSNVLVTSSFIYEKLIKEDLDFGAYILLVYSQFLGRTAVDLSESHRESMCCINDHCGNQIEMLRVFSNQDVFCESCFNKIVDEDKVSLVKSLFNLFKHGYKKSIAYSTNTPKHAPKDNIEVIKDEVNFNIGKENSYEFESYMAKKCANLSELYKKLNSVLCNPNFEISGYSLYEVDGGWRNEIALNEVSQEDVLELKRLNKKFDKAGFKDLVRPITDRLPFCVVYDEASIVLRIIFNSREEITSFDPAVCKVTREITEIFKDITKTEDSIFFTIKKLHKVGCIERIGEK